jgi:hypothetical protein
MKTKIFMVLATVFFLLPRALWGATFTATSCSQSDVSAAISSASNGDTVQIPNGSCTWSSGISTTKEIVIRAQNYTPISGGNTNRNVVITHNASVPLFNVTSGNSYHVEIAGIKFIEGSIKRSFIRTSGSGSKVILVHDCWFEHSRRDGDADTVYAIVWMAQGGILWNCFWNGTDSIDDVGQGGMLIKSPRAWATASTMGIADTNGAVNVYIEDSTIYNVGLVPDCDDGCRIVSRFNVFMGSWAETHGFSSTYGGRHWEFYKNTFSNIARKNLSGRYFWGRAGTGVFHDNVVNDGDGYYGSMVQVEAGDDTACTGYPQFRQFGWGHNGTSNVSDPVYLWNQSGSKAYSYGIRSGWSSCIQLNRDIFVNTAKPGYMAYTYPHPLRSKGNGLGAPTGLRILQ